MAPFWLLSAALILTLGGCRPSRAGQSAGHVGCRPSEITISDETVANDGFLEGSENWVAECNGRRYICTENTQRHFAEMNVMVRHSDVSCTEEHSSSASASAAASESTGGPTHESPSAGGGFQLGVDAQAAMSACEAAGHQWQLQSPSQASCSGAAVSIGLPARVEVGICAGAVCRVTLVHEPEGNWLNVIGELRSKLEAKYGPPGTRQGTVPDGCQTAEAFATCLNTRRMRLRYGWSWGSGQTLTLLVGIPLEGGTSAIRIIYAGAARSGKVKESAL